MVKMRGGVENGLKILLFYRANIDFEYTQWKKLTIPVTPKMSEEW